MKKCIPLLLRGLLMVGFMATNALAFEVITKPETVILDSVEIEVLRTADNFIVLFDSSASMGDLHEGTQTPKIEFAKAALKERNAMLPDLTFNAGLYTISPGAWKMTKKSLKAFYPVQPYNKQAFGKAIDNLPTKASGPTLLQGGLQELDKILEGLSGRTVVIVFSDGRFTSPAERSKPASIARKLSAKYNVCFYVVSSAPSADEAKMLEAVASINACSRVIPFKDFCEAPGYMQGALFVINSKVVRDVVNIERVVGIKSRDFLFGHDSDSVQEEDYTRLDLLGEFMKKNPDPFVIVTGFTDSTGPAEYNLALSKRRAESVSSYLFTKHQIDPSRIVRLWYGEAAPVASNDTREGRSQNRRVSIILRNL